ncbi:hypothetical protein [Tessaracoccus antarcticus]|uniref:hypothetical protein n=1 Tax=Tessaracoccus antarcticus TaxID=2479848 RepID=UPI001F31B264|nr:hypothetical protein [Tessaracoccus antarcticus]
MRARRRRALRVRRDPTFGALGDVTTDSAEAADAGAVAAEALLAADALLLALRATGFLGAGTAVPSGRVAHSTADWLPALGLMVVDSAADSCVDGEPADFTPTCAADDALLGVSSR